MLQKSTPDRQDNDAASQGRETHNGRFWTGLSGKVLTLTILFVMLGEVLIFVPSISSFRINWLKAHIATAELTALSLKAVPPGELPEETRNRIIDATEIDVLAVAHDGMRELVFRRNSRIVVDETIELDDAGVISNIPAAIATLVRTMPYQIGVNAVAPKGSFDKIQITMNDRPLRQAMIIYTRNILVWSLVLCAIVAALVFFAINRLLVRPIIKMSNNMLAFTSAPEVADKIIQPAERNDELGIAEHQLAHMQTELSGLLSEKNRLAELGLAVSKISHDLRNMLSSAQLISDRLAGVEDPTVQRFAPKLVASLDRAIDFCAQTLKFGQAREAPPLREQLDVRELVNEVIEATIQQAPGTAVLFNDVEAGTPIDADRDHLFRILDNIIRNAAQVLEQSLKSGVMSEEGHVRVSAKRDGTITRICIRDNGPGVPERAKEHLFQAFKGSLRSGGVGLGLTISQELARAHGGMIELVENGPGENGAAFDIIIEDRTEQVKQGYRGKRANRAA